MTDQPTFEYHDEDGDDLSVRPMRGIPAVLILTGTNGIAVDLDRVEEVIAGIRDAARTAAARQTTGQPPAAEHPMAHALRLGAATIPETIVAEICEATNSGIPLPWPEYTDRDAEVWHLTDETHDGDRVMLPSACDMQPMLRRDVERFFGPLSARQTTGQDDTWPLATPCAYCSHTLNWHVTGGRCRVASEEARCGCSAFVAPGGSHPDPVVVDEFIRDMAKRHVCENCDGVDPDTCLTNPDRAPAVGQPAEAHTADEAEASLVHVGWWCWRGNDHGHLAEMACRSDNVPIHVPAEWADDMRAVVQHLTDDHEPGQDCTWVTPEEQAAETQAAADTVEDER